MAEYVLEILDGDRAGEVVALSARLRIGRKPTNDLTIQDEKTSGAHCEVLQEGDRHVLRDLGSTNGTLIDGKRITEVVLTPGDVFQAGRVRIGYRQSDAPSLAGTAAGGGAEDLTVHRLDQSRLQGGKRGGTLALLVLLVLAGGGAVAWQFLRPGGGEGGGGGPRQRAPLQVAGNRLPGAAGSCEDEQGWTLRAAGLGFTPGSGGNTGAGCLEAARPEAGGDDFAMARLAEPLTVIAGRALTLSAHLRTLGGGQAGVRLRFFSSVAGNPLAFRAGTRVGEHDGWSEVRCQATVPPGADRVEVELVAALPGSGAVAQVDDVALVETGSGESVNLQAEQTGQTLLGAGGGVALRSTDPEQPAILHTVRPELTSGALLGLHKAGLTCLTDVGGSLTATATERGFALAFQGVRDLLLEFPAEAEGGLLQRTGQEPFATLSEGGAFTAQQVLLGDGRTRVLLSLPAPASMTGKAAGGRFRLALAAEQLELVVNLRAEKLAAQEQIRAARAEAGRAPGVALDRLRDLARNLPHDTDSLREAQSLRGELQQALADRLARLRRNLDDASYFDTRGGFQRVVEGIDELIALYGEHNLPDAEAVQQARATAAGRLTALDAVAQQAAKKRLEELARLFGESGQEGLSRLVRDYLEGK